MVRKQQFLIELLIPIFSSWDHLEPSETAPWGTGNARSANGTSEGPLEQSRRLYLERAKRKWNSPLGRLERALAPWNARQRI